MVIAYGTSAGYDTAPRLLQALTERLPEVELATRVLAVGEIVAGLAAGSVDVGVVRCPPATAGLEARLLRLEAQGVLVRADDADSGRPARLEELDRVLLHPRAANPGHYDAVVALLGGTERVEHRRVSVDLADTPVQEGRAVALVGESVLAGLPAALAWRPLTPPAALPVSLLARTLDRSPATSAVLAAAEAVADALGWRDAGAA